MYTPNANTTFYALKGGGGPVLCQFTNCQGDGVLLYDIMLLKERKVFVRVSVFVFVCAHKKIELSAFVCLIVSLFVYVLQFSFTLGAPKLSPASWWRLAAICVWYNTLLQNPIKRKCCAHECTHTRADTCNRAALVWRGGVHPFVINVLLLLLLLMLCEFVSGWLLKQNVRGRLSRGFLHSFLLVGECGSYERGLRGFS